MLDNKKRKYLRNSCITTIIKYSDLVDFSKIANVDILAYRYLLLNLLVLSDDYKMRNGGKN